MIVGSVELPLKSKQPIDGMNAFKKQAKKGFYSKNTIIPSASAIGQHSRSPSKSSVRHTPHKDIPSPTSASQSKLSMSKAYDMRNRDRNKQRENSVIKNAQKILYNSRSSKPYDNSARKSKDLERDRDGESVSSFHQNKIENVLSIPSDDLVTGFNDSQGSGSKLPKGAKRVKPEGSGCMHRKGGKPTPADLECTFKPTINRNSRALDKKKQEKSISPMPISQRHNRLLDKGAEYAENRKQRAMIQMAQEELKDEKECSFKPAKVAQYEGVASNELPIEERSSAWRKRRDERIARQRKDLQQRAEEEIRRQTIQNTETQSGHQNEYDEGHKRTARDYVSGSPQRSRDGKIMVGNYSPKRQPMTDDEYVNVRLDNIRRSIENQMSYTDSKRSWSRSRSRE